MYAQKGITAHQERPSHGSAYKGRGALKEAESRNSALLAPYAQLDQPFLSNVQRAITALMTNLSPSRALLATKALMIDLTQVH